MLTLDEMRKKLGRTGKGYKELPIMILDQYIKEVRGELNALSSDHWHLNGKQRDCLIACLSEQLQALNIARTTLSEHLQPPRQKMMVIEQCKPTRALNDTEFCPYAEYYDPGETCCNYSGPRGYVCGLLLNDHRKVVTVPEGRVSSECPLKDAPDDETRRS